ncbi:MAG: hypothetical protein LBQ10_12065 [Desulfovibrio sp.]|nr:hypothetical protein [Desulfovibrio sp.]
MMETFERETIRQLARLDEQNQSIMRTLDEMRGARKENDQRLKKLEFAAQYRAGIVAVIVFIGSVFGGLAVVILQWFLGTK